MKRDSLLALLLVSSVFLANNLCAQSTVCFTSGADNLLLTGSTTQSVAVGDFNSDGVADLAAANFNNNTISILRNQGDRSFSQPENIPTAGSPLMVISDDFNNDHQPDLAVATTVAIAIYQNVGSIGTAGFALVSTYDGLPFANIVKSGDFNNDGNADIVAVFGNSVKVIFGKGTGAFDDPVKLMDTEVVNNVVTADFTGNNVDDIAFINDGTLHIFAYSGGAFADNEVMSTTASFITSADFNGDNDEDILFPDAGKLLLGDGSGAFPNSFDIPDVFTYGPVVVGDLNGDDYLDVAITNLAGSIAVLYATSNTSFDEHVNFFAGSAPSNVAIYDIDQDERPDLIATEGDDRGGVMILYNEGDTFVTPEAYHVGDYQSDVMTEDLNNDDRRDIVVLDYLHHHVSVLMQVSNGTFEAAPTSVTSVNEAKMIPGDYNSDGKMDFATNDYTTGKVSLFYGNGAGAFAAGPVNAYNVDGIVGGDFNGDSKPDLAVNLRSTNFIGVLKGDGAGGFTQTSYDAGGTTNTIYTGDFDNDGTTDLAAIATNATKVLMFPGNGDGTFDAAVNMSTGIALGYTNYAADLNDDGRADIISLVDTEAVVLINSGTSFTAITTIEMQSEATAVTTGYFDGDDIVDLAIGGQNIPNSLVYIGKGDGTFNDPIQFASGPAWTLLATDIDNDGATDILASQASGEMLVVLRNNSAHITSSAPAPLCGGSIDLIANENGFNYLWLGPEGSSPEQNVSVSTRGTYILRVSNASETCKTIASITIEGKPQAAETDVINPTCSTATGSIVITKQDNSDIYSFDNGETFDNTNIMSDLPPGEYSIIIQNSDGCNSNAATVTIEEQPTAPGKPVVNPIDPDCSDPLGTIIVTIQKEGDTYSFDNGETYQALNYADDTQPGTYQVVIRRSLDCISEMTEVTINAGPEIPSQPTLTATSGSGAITLTSSTGSGYVWMKDGLAIDNASAQTYDVTESGAYAVIVLSADGCESEPSLAYAAIISGDIRDMIGGFYPNPADTHIYYKTSNTLVNSAIYSSSGKEMDVTPSWSGDQLIYDIGGFSPGVYLLKITTGSETKTIKWLKR